MPGRYPIERGTLATSGGLAFAAPEFEQHIIEEHVARSTALHARLAGNGQGGNDRYLTGPLARYTLNSGSLPPLAAQAQALDRMPGTLILHAVEAGDVGQGTGLTPAVAEVIDVLTAAVLHDLDRLRSQPG